MSGIDLLNITPPPAWMARGTCAQVGDPELFYPEGEPVATARAKQVCAGCPVRAECLAYALGRDERHGIWGGMSAWQRRKLVGPRDRRTPSAGVRERATEIRRLTAGGLSDRQVADRIGVTDRTVLRIRSRFGIPPSRPPSWANTRNAA
ncbi:MAG TPA: WhiB family transcriptional regulator [Pseudonocardiaceae bacterium]|nr:WhiB family transcriptional regulator [Pseudonocardiaceae bacterium]